MNADYITSTADKTSSNGSWFRSWYSALWWHPVHEISL